MAAEAAIEPEQKTVHIAGIDRSKIRGSFLIAAWAELEDKKQLIGIEPVLSRWQVAGCANCQTRLRVSADLSLPPTVDSASEPRLWSTVYPLRRASRWAGECCGRR